MLGHDVCFGYIHAVETAHGDSPPQSDGVRGRHVVPQRGPRPYHPDRQLYGDGDEGILRYRGCPTEELAENSTFLEVAYCLLYGFAFSGPVGGMRICNFSTFYCSSRSSGDTS